MTTDCEARPYRPWAPSRAFLTALPVSLAMWVAVVEAVRLIF